MDGQAADSGRGTAHRREIRDRELIEKIRSLSADKVVEVEDFVDFLRQREEGHRLAKVVTSASEAAFAKVWDNPDDAEYDRL